MAHAKGKGKGGNGNGGNGGKSTKVTVADADIVRTKRLELVGSDGRQRAVFSVDAWDGSPGIVLADESGKARAMFAVTEKGPLLGLLNARSKPAIMMALTGDSPAVTLFDGADRPRAEVRVAPNSVPMLRLLGTNGKSRIRLEVPDSPDHGPAMSLYAENEKTRAMVCLVKDAPALIFLDRDGKEHQAGIYVADDGAEIAVYGEGGESASLTSEGVVTQAGSEEPQSK